MIGRRPLMAALFIAAATLTFEMWRLQLPFLGYFQYSAWADGPIRFGVHIAGVIAILGVQVLFIWSALVSSRGWQALCLALFTLVTFTEFGYVRATGALMNAHDIDVALENTKYWSAMATAFLNWWALVPCAIFAAGLAASRPHAGRHARRFAVVAGLIVAVHSSYAANGLLHRAPDVGMSSGAPVPTGTFQGLSRAVTMFAWNSLASRFNYHLRDLIPDQAVAIPQRHVVLVIDESISAGHLSIDGYPRPTTPWLDELQRRGAIDNWGVAASATNNSNGSVLSILTGVDQLPDTQRRTLKQATLFQYAKAMKYRTHLLDGELNGRRFGLSWEDLKFVDDFRSAEAFGDDADSDFRIAHDVSRLLEAPEGQFVVVLKRGNHFPHKKNYPPGQGVWQPSSDTHVPSGAERAALTNTYDNAIRYNLDGFFRALLRPDGSLPRTTVLYTSDHGEVVGGEGTEPLARTLAWGLVAVPLLMAGDLRPAVDTGYRASHHNLFPTVLDLLGVPASARIGSFRRSLLTARATDRDPRLVLGGFVFGAAGDELRDLDSLLRPVALTSSR
jgi:glucan phosphoethanolaminetransferase (alkaline phosphatase superfamily)